MLPRLIRSLLTEAWFLLLFAGDKPLRKTRRFEEKPDTGIGREDGRHLIRGPTHIHASE